MITESGVIKTHDRNFLLDEGKLRKLIEVIEQYCSKKELKTEIKFAVIRQDSTYYVTSIVDEVLADDNTGSKKIITLIIELYCCSDANENNKTKIMQMRLRIKGDDKIEYNVSDPDRDWCFRLAEEIDIQLQRSIRPRRLNWIYNNQLIDLGITYILLSIPLFIIVIMILYQPNNNINITENATLTSDQKLDRILDQSNKPNIELVMLPIFLLLYGISTIIVDVKPISKIINIFDKSVFYWGDEIEKYDNYNSLVTKIRWGILVTLIISIISGVIVASIM